MPPHVPEDLIRRRSAGEVHGVHIVERHEVVVSTAAEGLQALENLVVRQAIPQDFLDLLAQAPELPAPPDGAFSNLRKDLAVDREGNLRHTVSGIDVSPYRVCREDRVRLGVMYYPLEAEGEAISFATSEEENDLHGIERALGKPIPRVTLPDFDDKAPPPKVRWHPSARYRAGSVGSNGGTADGAGARTRDQRRGWPG